MPNIFEIMPHEIMCGSLVRVADMNGDGRPDLVGTDTSSMLCVILNQGTSTFLVSYTIPTSSLYYSVEALDIVDVNGDSKSDIILSGLIAIASVSRAVTILLNQGNDTFVAPVQYNTGNTLNLIAVADVNGDGKPDIAASADTAVYILLNQGNGTFTATYNDNGWGYHPSSIALADVSGDGKMDVVIVSLEKVMFLLINQGSGTFSISGGTTFSAPRALASVVDVNGDGKPDIVTYGVDDSYAYSMNYTVSLNQGGGTFPATVEYKGCSRGAWMKQPVVVDINGDSKPDIVNNCGCFLNQGDGTFGASMTFYGSVSLDPFLVVDFNGDGKQDIVGLRSVVAQLPSASGTGTAMLGSGGVTVRLGQGSGIFSAAVDYYALSISIASTYSYAPALHITAADINADSKPDILVFGQSSLGVLLGTCSGITEAGPSCTPCPSNQYTIDHITCSPCGGGNYAGFGSSCTPCAAGYYNSLGNGTACIIAPAGTYVEGTGFTKPTPCPAGTYSTTIGATSSDTCLAAPAGSFTNTKIGATTYTQCPSGYYNPGVGYGSSYADTNACKQCPAGFITSLNSTVCAPCSNTVQVNSTGLYNGTNCNDVFEITTLSNVTIDLCSGGADTIVAHSTSNPNQQITLRCFNISDDKLQFSGAQCIDDKDFNFTDC